MGSRNGADAAEQVWMPGNQFRNHLYTASADGNSRINQTKEAGRTVDSRVGL